MIHLTKNIGIQGRSLSKLVEQFFESIQVYHLPASFPTFSILNIIQHEKPSLHPGGEASLFYPGLESAYRVSKKAETGFESAYRTPKKAEVDQQQGLTYDSLGLLHQIIRVANFITKNLNPCSDPTAVTMAYTVKGRKSFGCSFLKIRTQGSTPSRGEVVGEALEEWVDTKSCQD
jgi:hypothetical protein